MLIKNEVRLDKLIPMKIGVNFILYPNDMDKEVVKDLESSLIKYTLGYKSVDYSRRIREEYDGEENLAAKSEFLQLLNDILISTEKGLDKCIEYFKSISQEVDCDSDVASLAVLNRLFNSYETTTFLIRNGCFAESMVINRLIFEQLCYCLNLFKFDFKELENRSSKYVAQKISPTKIHNLRELFPDDEIGKEYSILSDAGHLGFNSVNSYFSIKDDQNVITTKSSIQVIDTALRMFKLIDLQGVIQEVCFSKYSKLDRTKTRKLRGQLIPKKTRQMKKDFEMFLKRYNEVCKKNIKTEIRDIFSDQKVDDELPF